MWRRDCLYLASLALFNWMGLLSAQCYLKVDQGAVFCCGATKVTLSLSCPADHMILLKKAALYSVPGFCPSEAKEVPPSSCTITDSIKAISQNCDYVNSCSLDVDISPFGFGECQEKGSKFLFITYQCDPEFYESPLAKSTVISSMTEGDANLLYIYSHPSVAEVKVGCIIKILGGTETSVEVTFFRKFSAKECAEKVTTLLVDKSFDICDAGDKYRQLVGCTFSEKGLFIQYNGEAKDVRPEFTIKISTPATTNGIQYRCGADKSSYLKEFGGELVTQNPGGPNTTTRVISYPRTSNYDLLIGAVCSAAILVVLIVIATLAIGCKKENEKLKNLEDDADGRFTTVRKNIYLGGDASSKLVLTKSEQVNA